ncbi:MAG TPA: PIN domain-containing protein [Thermoanaerobaculia bacterium]|nr:PIN domain-containing protein [Thermoanaerobaculia bacterium]
MRAYVDSDILIWHLRGERRAADVLRRLSAEAGMELWTGALQRAEVVFFMRPEEESPTLSFLSRFKTEAVTREVVDQAGLLYRRWHPSHEIDVNDAILAATVAATGGKIYTQNVKHYPMPDIAVTKGW